MTLIRAQVSVQADTAFPRDAFVMTPCFKTTQVFAGPDYDGLATDLAAGFSNWHSAGAQEFKVKLYDIEDPPPSPPKASKKSGNPGSQVTSKCPREVALCLSFYAGENTARRRGRLYVPATLVLDHVAATGVSAKPTTTMLNGVKDLVAMLSGIGGLNVDWVVYSKVDREAHTVTNAFVDDEWDTQRRRGLKSTTRVAATTSG